MENQIEDIRKTYVNNLFRIIRHFGAYHGSLMCSRALPKYKIDKLALDTVDCTKPFCVYTDKIALCSTEIQFEGQRFLRYLEVASITEAGTELGALLYNYNTGTVRLLFGDKDIVAFLFILPSQVLPEDWKQKLKLI